MLSQGFRIRGSAPARLAGRIHMCGKGPRRRRAQRTLVPMRQLAQAISRGGRRGIHRLVGEVAFDVLS